MRDALARQEFDLIRQIGHGIKGAGGSYGLDDISAYGRLLEEAAVEKNGTNLYETIEALNRFLEHLQLVYV